jgi:hypothetical protein
MFFEVVQPLCDLKEVAVPEPFSSTGLRQENHRPEVTDKLLHKLRKRKGDLKETLDCTLEPRLPPGRPGRRKGSANYQWTPEADRILEELSARLGPSTAKHVMQKKLLEERGWGPGEYKPRPDSVRNAVERRMEHLGLPTGRERQGPAARTAKPWTPAHITALLGALGGDLIDKSLEQRTEHSIKAVRAKLARLSYTAEELRSVSYTVDEVAAMLNVTARQVRRWKENGCLKTTRRRITDKDLAAFIKDHHQRIPYDRVASHFRVSLLDLGYPAQEAPEFQAAVKSILNDVAGRKKRSDARADNLEIKPSRAKRTPLHWLPLASRNSGLGMVGSA